MGSSTSTSELTLSSLSPTSPLSLTSALKETLAGDAELLFERLDFKELLRVDGKRVSGDCEDCLGVPRFDSLDWAGDWDWDCAGEEDDLAVDFAERRDADRDRPDLSVLLTSAVGALLGVVGLLLTLLRDLSSSVVTFPSEP